MNFLQRWILGKKNVQALENIKAIQTGVRYAVQNGRLVTPEDSKITYITEGYNKNDIVYSVVNIVLDKVRLPEWELYKVVNESSLKKYHRIMRQKTISSSDYKEAMKYKAEGLEPYTSFNLQLGKLNDLLEYPNEYCTFQDFITYGSLYKMLTGDAYMWGEVLKAGANKGIPNALWVLPSQHMTINVTDEFPSKITGYELLTWNQKFSTESILQDKYDNPNWDINGQQHYGFAPLRPFLMNLTRNNAAKVSSAAKFHNGGLDEIIYFDDPRFTAQEGLQQVNALKIKLAEEYSGPANQGKRAVSGMKVGVAPLGSTPVELGIIDSEKWDAIMFCNGYGVPPVLLGFEDMTYNNMKEAEKALTTRSAIPLLSARRNGLNRKIQKDWGFKGVNVYIDYKTECFTELQTDVNETMTAYSMLTMVTPNEERLAINMEARPEPEADKPWIKTGAGRQPLEDYQANQVDQALMNEANRNAIERETNSEDGKKGISNSKRDLPGQKEKDIKLKKAV